MLIDKVVAHTIKRPRKRKSSIAIFAACPTRNRSESLCARKSTLALYLLGNIQTGKSKKKTLIPRMGPGLEENLLSQASTYVRNIQTGKSKKLFLSFGNVPAGKGVWSTAPYLVKEHREGKKAEKILVPVRFSRDHTDERNRVGRHEPRTLFCLGDVSYPIPASKTPLALQVAAVTELRFIERQVLGAGENTG
jgi:hypothetical protein